MTPDRKVLKKVQQTAAAVLEKANGAVKQGKVSNHLTTLSRPNHN